jgi:methylphosphotriester-DNA--protein-cysteine methyltransferase
LTGDCPTRRSTPCALQRKSLLTVHETRPELDANGAAARTAEDELLYALALATETVARDMTSRGRPMVSRRTIIARVHEWIDAPADAPVHVTDRSDAARVSVRTLRNAFVEWYGVGPHTYLSMRQLHQIRAHLLAAEPGVRP